MISIKSKYDCCGCEACAQRCAHNAISMKRDKEGFLYPIIDPNKCTKCDICEKVCPVINQKLPSEPIKTYAAKNKDEIVRLQSSSGGIFTLLATKTINNGGVVFGAKFDEQWKVVHDYVETIEDLAKFRGSKYVQSRINDNYIKVEQFLKQGRQVLFSGTPCQIAGLKKYLIIEYKNLICADIICHGVPSPMIWQKYKAQFELSYTSSISFRDKSNSWKTYEVVVSKDQKEVIRETVGQNVYMKIFLSDLCLRPSCAICPAKDGKSKSDITIADFWGIQHIHPEFDDDKGCNLVLINSEKGLNFFNKLECDKIESDFNTAIKYNPSYFKSVSEPKYRQYFFDNFDKFGFSIYNKIQKEQQPSLIRRIASRIKRIITK